MADSARYPIPSRVHRVDETIQRSRFITTAAHASDAEAAQAFIQAIRDEFPDAAHHCWAFVAGPPASTTHIGMSDDGEPHGTAGRPMLTSLLHGGVGEIVAVCTRYYGGVKLGTGGLARAYSGGVKLALETLPTDEKVTRVWLVVTVGYADVDGMQRLIDELDIVVENEEYGAEVQYVLGVPSPDEEVLRTSVGDLTRGKGRVEVQ